MSMVRDLYWLRVGLRGRGVLISPCGGCGLSPLIRSALAARQLLPVVTRDKGSPKLLFKRHNVVTAPALAPATIAVHLHVLHLHTFYLLNSSENISISLNSSRKWSRTSCLRQYFQYIHAMKFLDMYKLIAWYWIDQQNQQQSQCLSTRNSYYKTRI